VGKAGVLATFSVGLNSSDSETLKIADDHPIVAMSPRVLRLLHRSHPPRAPSRFSSGVLRHGGELRLRWGIGHRSPSSPAPQALEGSDIVDFFVWILTKEEDENTVNSSADLRDAI
jgi:hypothetical protein